jgi:5'-nucleotidase
MFNRAEMELRETVLLTNDDGFQASGIRYLYDELKSEYKVTVVAPDRERSGVGHAFTFNTHIHYEKSNETDPMQGYIVNGTPADCVKFAVSYLLSQRPDVVISGLNIGENSGLSAFYSGTVAAAREAAFWGIPGFAFSVCKESEEYAADYASLVPLIVREILNTSDRDPKVFYNVNFPACRMSEVKGTRITWQSMAFFDDRYERMEVESHRTREGFMIYGEKKDIEESDAYDSRALMNKIISITPLSFDSTAHGEIPHLRRLEEIDFLKGDNR